MSIKPTKAVESSRLYRTANLLVRMEGEREGERERWRLDALRRGHALTAAEDEAGVSFIEKRKEWGGRVEQGARALHFPT